MRTRWWRRALVLTADLYFFWSRRCSHCQDARPFVESLPEKFPWIRLHSLEVLEYPENRVRFEEMAAEIGIAPQSVPTFMWCGQHATGYAGDLSTGRFLVTALSRCYRDYYAGTPAGFDDALQSAPDAAGGAQPVVVPWLGGFDPAQYSLPVLAVVLGMLDAFNPGAFFVLLFLLSLLVNTRSRGRMLAVGGLFVVVSGAVYFAFMAAWLNLFQVLDQIQAVTLIAGPVAVAIGLINIKDYFWFRQGVSLSLSDRHKERLFDRMRGLMSSNRLLRDSAPPAVRDHLASTLTLAVVANTYESLCTVGLPMVFTRALTLEQLPAYQYYVYLALYNLVYV